MLPDMELLWGNVSAGIVLITGGISMADWGTIPQWITAGIAFGAGVVAVSSIITQRELARKKAAFDFFAKTEMDKSMLDAHNTYLDGIKELKEFMRHNDSLEKFTKTHKEHYRGIRSYLNLHELMGVGIEKNVFDDYVCFDYWADELYRICENAAPVIKYVRDRPDGLYTYTALIELQERWKDRDRNLLIKQFGFKVPIMNLKFSFIVSRHHADKALT